MNTIDKRLPNSELLYKHNIDIFINETWQKQFVMVDIVTNRATNDDYKNMST